MKKIKPNIKAQSGWIKLCKFCGEQVGNTQTYCPSCKTQAGRKEVFEENAKIINENKEKGFDVPETLKDWH